VKALVVALIVGVSGCAELDVSDTSKDNDARAAAFSTGSAAALGIGLVALLTERGGTGEPVSGRRDIALAIARGQGPFVSDLAGWLELPESMLPALGECLREARPVLEAALSDSLSQKSFETLIGVALCRDERLRYHAWKRYDCARIAPLSTLTEPDSK